MPFVDVEGSILRPLVVLDWFLAKTTFPTKVPKIVDSGYLAVGKKKLTFTRQVAAK